MGLDVTGVVQNACQKAFGSGEGKKGLASPTKIKVGLPEDGCCEFPPNPFPKINPTNPVSWYGEISNAIGGLYGTQACLESETTGGILGDPSYNPQANIHKRFQVAALLRRFYDLLKWIVEIFRQNLQAEKDTIELFKPARSTVAIA